MPEVAAVTPYSRSAGSSRVRIYDWLAHTKASAVVYPYAGLPNASPGTLANHPIAVLKAERLLRRLANSRSETILLHREASPLSRGGLEETLLRSANFSVYDFDDALQWDDGGGSLLRRSFAKSVKCRTAVRSASRIIAGSDTLANWAIDFNKDVVVIPSCVEPDSYQQKRNFALHDPPRLVWIGSASTEQYLLAIEGPLLEMHRRLAVRLRVVSAGNRSLGALDAMIDRFDWTERDSDEIAVNSDIAIAPLADTLYARGKCAYKILQYAAHSLPTVGSPIGANATALSLLGGLAARTPAEWVEHLLALLAAPASLRASIGVAGREAVAREYSFASWERRWRSAVGLDRVAGR